MREISGKGCLCLIALVMGIFVGNEFYWILNFPIYVSRTISLITAVAIAWFLLKKEKPR